MSEVIIRTDFVQPRPQEALNGELGLTASDIAASIKTEVRLVRRKLEGRGFIERLKRQGYQCVPSGIANKINGVEFTEFTLDVQAAKFFVAKYDSQDGDDYLSFLIRLESEIIPALKEENRLLRELTEKLCRRRTVKEGGVVMIQRTVLEKCFDIFKQPFITMRKELVPKDSLMPEEMREYRVRHRNKTMKGITEAQEKDLENVLFLGESSAKNITDGKH